MDLPEVESREAWIEARKALLALEKASDRERDRLTEARRRLSRVRLDKAYVFDGPLGEVSLGDLFAGRRPLIVYHLMFEPTRASACKHCTCIMDNIARCLVHLAARDTAFAAVSRAPIAKIEAFRRRMKWAFPWVSLHRNDFNYDFHVTLDPTKGSTEYNDRPFALRGELPGLSAFLRDRDGEGILHSYSTDTRGLDMPLPMYHLLDRTPLGRQETRAFSMAAGEDLWICQHDLYERGGPAGCACGT